MNIICLYWEGDFRNRDYTVKDIERLKESIDRHIDRDYTLYCLTNSDKEMPCKKIMIKHDWPGWWSKMELHRPDLPEGRTLYMDLDSHVVDNLGPILDYPGNLVMFRSPLWGRRQVTRDGIVFHRYQAATMLFTPGEMTHIYERFCKKPKHYINKYRSDQDIMAAWIPQQPLFPREWMMKLKDCKKLNSKPANVIIVTGRPGDGSFRDMEKYKWVEKAARGGEICT